MSAGGRQSMYAPYGQQPPPPHHQQHPAHPHPRPGYPILRRDIHKRDEIILSMDDRVVGLRRALPSRADTSSTYSTVPSYATLPR